MIFRFYFHRAFSTTTKNPKSKLTLETLAKSQSLQGKRILVRTDFNVPVAKTSPYSITDDTRIRAVLPTINLLLKNEAKVVICSHMGRPKGKVNDGMRLNSVATRLAELLKTTKVIKTETCVGPEVKNAIEKLQDGQVLLLENLRFHKEEEKNDPEFAKALATNMDIYVNDAFGTAHRAHASTEGVTKYIDTCVSGFLLDKELKYLAQAVDAPRRPLAAIIGGAKVSTKIPVLESLLRKCDKIFLGGGMIFTFYKAQGLPIGKSIVEEDKVEFASKLLKIAKEKNVELVLPTDVVVADSFSAEAETKVVKADSIPNNWIGLDIGPKSCQLFEEGLSGCKTVVWNGPMGAFEIQKFAQGTNQIAKLIAELTKDGATTIVGGGDSVAAVEKSGLANQVSHISTGGGASLELLEGKVLPGVAALNDA